MRSPLSRMDRFCPLSIHILKHGKTNYILSHSKSSIKFDFKSYPSLKVEMNTLNKIGTKTHKTKTWKLKKNSHKQFLLGLWKKIIMLKLQNDCFKVQVFIKCIWMDKENHFQIKLSRKRVVPSVHTGACTGFREVRP